jgi:hypothetical protein
MQLPPAQQYKNFFTKHHKQLMISEVIHPSFPHTCAMLSLIMSQSFSGRILLKQVNSDRRKNIYIQYIYYKYGLIYANTYVYVF